MKSKLLILAIIITATLGGFWVGRYCATVSWQRAVEIQIHNDAHTNVRNRTQINLQVLTLLQSGKQAAARIILERQLDVAVGQLAAFYQEDGDGNDIWMIRNARDYRLHHPWTNDNPVITESVHRAFTMAD